MSQPHGGYFWLYCLFYLDQRICRNGKTKITLNINVETEDKSESCEIYDDKLNYLQATINHEWYQVCFALNQMIIIMPKIFLQNIKSIEIFKLSSIRRNVKIFRPDIDTSNQACNTERLRRHATRERIFWCSGWQRRGS